MHDPAAPRRPCAPHRLRRLGRLGHEGKVELVVVVDIDTDPGAPWSILLAAVGDGAALRLHRDVSHRLSRPLLSEDLKLIDQLTAERTQLHRRWLTGPTVCWRRTVGPLHTLQPERGEFVGGDVGAPKS
ncbi:hypothetical protein [Streptomyces sp. NPDC057696]|uniref:hypothetical protein n=1 Tax=unclassified Streptomyces TaxID=2593676 RepID=UPI00367F516F